VVTLTDSGGILTLVEDDVTGLVVSPDAVSLAAALSRVLKDAGDAARLGGHLRARALGLGLTWGHVVDRLVA
jgi:glycosyltransferase involved in cell wall biosynthesis